MFSDKGIHRGCFPLTSTGKNWVLKGVKKRGEELNGIQSLEKYLHRKVGRKA